MSDHIDDIVQISPDVHKVIFENDVIRVLKVTVKPGATVPMHSMPVLIAKGAVISIAC